VGERSGSSANIRAKAGVLGIYLVEIDFYQFLFVVSYWFALPHLMEFPAFGPSSPEPAPTD
jgi:hypothetical protein